MPKFDVVVGNPPYQHPTNKRWKLWVTFIELSLASLKPNGILSLITPIAWMDKHGKEIGKARKLLTSKTLPFVNLNVNKHFNVGERIGYFICVNKENVSGIFTKIMNDTVEIGDKLLSEKPNLIALTADDKIKHEIISKIDASKFPKLGKRANTNLTEAKSLSPKRTSIYKYPVYHTASQLMFSSDKNLKKYMHKPKLIVNMSGTYYSPKNPDKYMKVTDNMVSGRGALQIITDSLEKAENIKSFLSSKLYRFYMSETKSGGFNWTPAGKLPLLDENKKWNDKKVYEIFDISPSEIKYIETRVK